MCKLSFDYDSRSGESVASYGALTVRAIQDSDVPNPWKDSDGFAPLLYHSLGDGGEEIGGADLESPLAFMSDWQISRNWRQLCNLLAPDANAEALSAELAAARRSNAPQWRGTLSALKRETLEERLADLKPDSRRSWPVDYYEKLAELWTLAGCVALDFQRNGYSQGDSVLGLLVATPKWREAMGIEAGADLAADLEAQADTFGAWAFGDCYGFAIKAAGETLDSCFGFIGSDFERSGLAEAAQEAADSILASAKRKRGDKLKELIRNRVPLHLRPALLEAAGALESSF